MPRGLFITGTGTGVGKTYVAALIAKSLSGAHKRVGVYKPVASGCERIDGAWRNEDALALQRASDPRPRYEDINPYALQAPLAPELAAVVDALQRRREAARR